MGRRRFEYAAAFFLLADKLGDAVSVLHNQLGDTQLAIAVARVYEGDDGPVLEQFLRDKVLPDAVKKGDRWLAQWCFWMLKKRDYAVRALVSPLSRLLNPPETPDLEAKSWTADDPALVVLYKQLREKSLSALKGASMVAGREEWSFVIKTASLYTRMGCEVLALDLVRNWEFLAPPPVSQSIFLKGDQRPRTPVTPISPIFQHGHGHGGENGLLSSGGGSAVLEQSPIDVDGGFDPRKLLRRRSSLVINDLPSREIVREVLAAGHAGSAVEELKERAREAREGRERKRREMEEEEKEEKDRKEKEKEEEKREGGEKEREEKKPKPPPTQFQEPDANSLLDAFGF